MNRNDIRETILQKYRQAVYSPEGLFAYTTGEEGARKLGYDEQLIADAPPGMIGSFCGVGNTFSLGTISPGESLLDVGCGSGFDLFVAARHVGPEGRVTGIDSTPDMVAFASQNIGRSGAKNINVCNAESESIPFGENTFDVVISNGVLNLSTMKDRSFSEIHRVLKPGGRLQFADIVLADTLPEELVSSLEAWSN